MKVTNNFGFDFTNEEILKTLKDLENYTLNVEVLLDRYSLTFPQTWFVMFNNQLHGVKVVLHHAYFLKHGKKNNENMKTGQYVKILKDLNPTQWEVIQTED